MMQLAGGKHATIRRAICAAYYDQLACPRMAQSPKHGFTRVLSDSKGTAINQNAVHFASRTQPNEATSDDEVESEDGTHIPAHTAKVASESMVKLCNRSSMWLPTVASSLASTDSLIVFSSQMLTDAASDGSATVQLVTNVSQDEVRAGAPEWCRIVDFDKLLHASARETLAFTLGPGVKETMLMGRGAWLTQLKHKFQSAIETTIRKGKLFVTCPRRSLARVEQHVRKHVQSVEPETIVLQLPDDVHMGKIIGKGGQQVHALETSIQDLLSSEHRGAGHRHVKKQRVLKVDSERKTIHVTLQGASKALMSVVVGRIQSAIVEMHGPQLLPMVQDPSGERGLEMQRRPRLPQLLSRVPPSAWETRDDVMLQLAHTLVWKCNASIYGGFVRDWVVRGEAANDIDVQVAPPLTTEQSITQTLTEYLSKSDHARANGMRVVRAGRKGAAHTLTITWQGVGAINIDLMDREKLVSVLAPPGVDSDAGNLLLNRSESLRKKVIDAGSLLSAALENVRKKRFEFFYPWDQDKHFEMSLKRLRKYLGRGWTCLSPVPRAVQRKLPDNERQFIKPPASK